MENGLLLFPELPRADARIQVSIGADGAAYPGIAFRAADPFNYELAYAVPHASDLWDAVPLCSDAHPMGIPR